MGIKDTQPSNSPIKRLFVRGVAWRSFADLLIRLRSFILLPILTRTFGKADYGIWTQISMTVTMLSSLGNFGVGASMQRYIPGLPSDQQREQFWMAIVVILASGFAIAIPVLLFAEILAKFFFGGTQNAIYVYLGVILMLSKLLQRHLLLYFRLTLKINIYSILLITQSILSLGAYLAAAIFGKELLIVVVVVIFVELLMTAIVLLVINKNLGWGRPNFSSLRKYLIFGLPTLPLGFLNWGVNSSDRYLIAFFRGTEELAIYAVAYGISAWTLQLVATPLFTSIPGALNSLWNSGKKEKAIELLKMIYKFFFLGATPIFSIVYFWRDFIIEKYVGSDYVSGGSIVVFVLFAYLLYYSSSFYRVIISWFEKTQIYMITFSIVAITNFILNLILVPQIGILGAAQSTTIAFALLFVLEYWYSRNLLNINLGIVRALLIFSIGFFLAWMFSMIPVDSIAGFIGSVSMFLVVYFGVVIGIRFVTIDEFKGITAQFKGQK